MATQISLEAKEGNPIILALNESVSFGRFMLESPAPVKCSVFSAKCSLEEELQKLSNTGAVAQKKAFFEARLKRQAFFVTATMTKPSSMIAPKLEVDDHSLKASPLNKKDNPIPALKESKSFGRLMSESLAPVKTVKCSVFSPNRCLEEEEHKLSITGTVAQEKTLFEAELKREALIETATMRKYERVQYPPIEPSTMIAPKLEGDDHNLKASPLNKKLLSSKGDMGVLRSIKRETTKPKEFDLRAKNTVKMRQITSIKAKPNGDMKRGLPSLSIHAKKGNPIPALKESKSFGRLMSESPSPVKCSVFSPNRCLEEEEHKLSITGTVAQEKTLFEAELKREAFIETATMRKYEKVQSPPMGPSSMIAPKLEGDDHNLKASSLNKKLLSSKRDMGVLRSIKRETTKPKEFDLRAKNTIKLRQITSIKAKPNGDMKCGLPSLSIHAKKGNPIPALKESKSFGRLMSESLAPVKCSVFSPNHCLEEEEHNLSITGTVAQEKTLFEAELKREAFIETETLRKYEKVQSPPMGPSSMIAPKLEGDDHNLKASSLNKKLLSSKGDMGVLRSIKRETTKPKEFDLRAKNTVKLRQITRIKAKPNGDMKCCLPSLSIHAKKGNPIPALKESKSFGRLMSESLAPVKCSVFSPNRCLEEEKHKLSITGTVAQEKTLFEAELKREAFIETATMRKYEKVQSPPMGPSSMIAPKLEGDDHNLKASPLTKKLLSSKGDIGVFRSIKRETTNPKEFDLRAKNTVKLRQITSIKAKPNGDMKRGLPSLSIHAKKDNPIPALKESKSFGRLMSESLAPVKCSVFSPNHCLEEEEHKLSITGTVAQEKTLFEAELKRKAFIETAAMRKYEKVQSPPMEPSSMIAPKLEGDDHNLKASPLNKKILSSKGDIGVFRSSKQETTKPKDFDLRTKNTEKLRHIASIKAKPNGDMKHGLPSLSIHTKKVHVTSAPPFGFRSEERDLKQKEVGTAGMDARPREPELETAHRAERTRPSSMIAPKLEGSDHNFKASPLNNKILSSKGDMDVFRSSKQATTKPKEFNLRTKNTEKLRQSTGIKAKSNGDMKRCLPSRSIHTMNVPVTHPWSLKRGGKPTLAAIRDKTSRPPRRPLINTESCKPVIARPNRRTTHSATSLPKLGRTTPNRVTSPTKKKTHENTSPNIQH